MASPSAASKRAASAVWPKDAANCVLTVSPMTARPIAAIASAPAMMMRPALRRFGCTFDSKWTVGTRSCGAIGAAHALGVGADLTAGADVATAGTVAGTAIAGTVAGTETARSLSLRSCSPMMPLHASQARSACSQAMTSALGKVLNSTTLLTGTLQFDDGMRAALPRIDFA